MAKGLTMMWQQDCSITEGICHLEWCEDESDTLHHFQPRTRELVLSFPHFFTLWSAGVFFHAEKTWVTEKLIFSSFLQSFVMDIYLTWPYLYPHTVPIVALLFMFLLSLPSTPFLFSAIFVTICCYDSPLYLQMFKVNSVKLFFFFRPLASPCMMKGHYLNPTLKDGSLVFRKTNWRQRKQACFPLMTKKALSAQTWDFLLSTHLFLRHSCLLPVHHTLPSNMLPLVLKVMLVVFEQFL